VVEGPLTLTKVEVALGEASNAIRSRLGESVDMVRSATALVLRFTSSESAVVVVAVDDAERPSFRVA